LKSIIKSVDEDDSSTLEKELIKSLDIVKLQDELNYKLLHFDQKYRILQHKSDLTHFKLFLNLPFEPHEVIRAFLEIDSI